jgi:hypothetical protein
MANLCSKHPDLNRQFWEILFSGMDNIFDYINFILSNNSWPDLKKKYDKENHGGALAGSD